MPQDTRRITGPEETQHPTKFLKHSLDASSLMSENGKRNDGREALDIRSMFLKVGVVSQAKGSAYIEMNNTKVICAVYGPREVPKKQDFNISGQLYCEVKFATFSCKHRRQHQQDNEEKEFSAVLLQALEPAVCMHKFPKAKVDVFVTVLENDGSAFAGAITCASAAIADANIEMYDLVIGCSLARIDDNTLLDPTYKEENLHQLSSNCSSMGVLTIGFMPSLQQISALIQDGELEHLLLVQSIKKLTEACHRIHPVVKQCLIKSMQRFKEKHSLDSKE